MARAKTFSGAGGGGYDSMPAMKRKIPKIKIERPKRRGPVAPAEKVIPDPRKEAERRKCREKPSPEEIEGS